MADTLAARRMAFPQGGQHSRTAPGAGPDPVAGVDADQHGRARHPAASQDPLHEGHQQSAPRQGNNPRPHPLARARSQSRARTDTGRGVAGRDGAGAHGRWRRRRCSTKCWPRASFTPSTKRSTPSSSKTACEKALFTSTVAPRTLCPPPSSFCSRCFFVRLQTHRPACTQQNLL